jgi:hypothetical protein
MENGPTLPPPSPGSATRNPELGRRFERARPDGLREPRVVSGPTPRLAKKSIRTQLHSLRRKNAPRTPTPGRYTRTPQPARAPRHPAATPAPRPAPRTRPLHPQPAAAPGQVHPTARSIASHRALRIQMNAGLQLLGTVSEPKRNNHPHPLPFAQPATSARARLSQSRHEFERKRSREPVVSWTVPRRQDHDHLPN